MSVKDAENGNTSALKNIRFPYGDSMGPQVASVTTQNQ